MIICSFPDLEPVCCSKSSSNCCFLTCIQITQEAGQVAWYSHLLKNFSQFVVIHTVKDFGVVNEAEVDAFLGLSSFFCDCGFSVFVLWYPLATPTVLLGFLLPWTWGISSWLLQQSTAAAPYLRRGVSPHHRPSWPWTWSSSSRPSCARAATAPWTWGIPDH